MLSKMHYAVEMARAGDRVFFVEPPTAEKIKTSVHVLEGSEGVTVIRFRQVPARRLLRNKAFWLYQILIKRYVKTILRITGSIDDLWCFDPNNYCDLSSFRAKHNLLLLYDFYKGKAVNKAICSADLLVSVSRLIIDNYKHSGIPQLFIQHGLSQHFEERSKARLEAWDFNHNSPKIKVGYVGNLLREGLCIEVMKQIITGHQDKEFHFWGVYELTGNNLVSEQYNPPQESLRFVQFLSTQQHVRLHGAVDQESLASGMFTMDVFLFLYSYEKDLNKASNAHKLMEYLSTGKVVVSTFVSNYQDTDLLYMTPSGKEQQLSEMFSEVMVRLDEYNRPDCQAERIRFALDNTYSNQVVKIRATLRNEL